jgi:hypothetical protein
VAVAVGVGVAVSVEVCVAVAVAVGVSVSVAVAVGVAVGVAVAVSVAVAVAVLVGVAVDVSVTVGVAVAVAEGVADSFVILCRCEAATVFADCSSATIRSYWPGVTAPMSNVMTEATWVGWNESESTVRPFCLCIFSSNRYALSGIPVDGWTVTPT